MAEYLRRKKKPTKAKIIQYAPVDSVEDEQQDADSIHEELSLPNDDDTQDQSSSSNDGLYLQQYTNDFNNSSSNANSQLFQEVAINSIINSQLTLDMRLNSNSWPEDHQAMLKSQMHQLIREHIDQISKDKLYLRKITDPSWMTEIRSLHEEWFPLNYPQSFYDKIYTGSFLCIGCFCEVKRGKKKKEVLLGMILARIQHGKEEINEIYQAKDQQNGRWLGWLGEAISCRERSGAYIATIGVVDECRRFGIGTMLLDEMENLVKREHSACEILYLHVVEYNETALRFYERNKFSTLKRIKNHYVIFEKDYDGYLLYKDIKNSGSKVIQHKEDNESQIDNPEPVQTQNEPSSSLLSSLTYPIRFVYQKLVGSQ